MQASTRSRAARYIAGGAFAFALLIGITSYIRIQVIYWYLSHCEVQSGACQAADGFITYWWALFVPALLVVAYLFYRSHAKAAAGSARLD